MFKHIPFEQVLERIAEKNAEFTFGVHAGELAKLVPDNQATIFSQEHTEKVIFALEKAVMGSVRSLNETYGLLRQAIMYSFLWREHPVFGIQFFVYRRTKQNNEGQLAQRLSLGAGGHFEIADVFVHENEDGRTVTSIIDLAATCKENYEREREEEIDGDDHDITPYGEASLHGFVMDSQPATGYVGNIHFGVLAGVQVIAPAYEPAMKEVHNKAEGWFTADELRSIATGATEFVRNDQQVNFEPWSQLMIAKIEELVSTLKEAA